MNSTTDARGARFESVVQTCKEISAFHKEEATRQQLALLEESEAEIVAELERRDKAAATAVAAAAAAAAAASSKPS